MEIKHMMKWLSIGLAVLVMTGCGVSDSGSDSQVLVPGGTAKAPAQMSLDVSNVIVKNAFYNYFKYSGKEGEKLRLDSVLEWAITQPQRMECQKSGETYIVVYDAGMNELNAYKTCTSTMTIEFPLDGTYIFQIKYPGNEGYFDADSTS